MTRRAKKNSRDHRPPAALADLSAEQIAEYAGVHLATARHWKAGRRDPSPQALELIQLKAAGRVIPNCPVWRSWRFVRDVLTGDNGESFHAQELAHYRAIVSLAAAVERDYNTAREHIRRLESYIRKLEKDTGAAPANEERAIPR